MATIQARKALIARLCEQECFEVEGTNIYGDMFDPITNNVMGLVHRVIERTMATCYYVAQPTQTLDEFREVVVKEFFGE